MAKKIIISIVIVLILVAGGGFFWWLYFRETPIEKWEEAKMSGPEDFIVKELPEGKLVENKKVGLTYEIPKDWILEKENPTRFYSPDTKFKEKTGFVIPERGCKIDVYASYIKTNLETLKKSIDEEFSKSSPITKLDEFSTIKVGNYPALRHRYHLDKFGISSILVDFPSGDKLYRILLSNPIGERERCEVEFNKFLETVSIK